MITNGKALLKAAKSAGCYIPALNIYNLETMRAALDASLNTGQSVILAFGAAYLAHASFETIRGIADALSKGHPYETVLHLDHCRDLALIGDALEAGFTSVMYDGSRLPLPENIQNTRKARQLADGMDASLEGELGGLNDESGQDTKEAFFYTDPAQARHYTLETGVDSLAVSIGNAHGLYKGVPHLNMERLAEINRETGLPLVLHGSTGIGLEQLQQAAALGVCKINVNTDIAMAASAAAREALEAPEGMRFEYVALRVREHMREVMESYFMRREG